ncbi:hypothetical protein PC116_g19594 [Phytophthora cactorum]|nr:hypothetical protein PC114_g18884 [Phytophthora cactorum]KAG4232163.1 hypothetical protein PC116_g19594 [Phytophthora cactorum]
MRCEVEHFEAILPSKIELVLMAAGTLMKTRFH